MPIKCLESNLINFSSNLLSFNIFLFYRINDISLLYYCDREISAMCRQSAGIFKEKFNEHKRKADLKNNED